MAESLVQRVRSVVGAENDDFFRTNTIVDYLNRSQNKVVSYLIKTETMSNQTLRALDKLRLSFSQATGTPGTAYGGYQYVDVVPDINGGAAGGTDQLLEILYVSFKDVSESDRIIRSKELTSKRLFLLDWGNIAPSQFETYYYVTGAGTTLRLFASNITATDELIIKGIKKPAELAVADTSVNIAQQYTNAVIYGAAIMLGVQEQRGNVNDMMELYKKELERNVY